MINYNNLKPGTVFILDGQPYQVVEFSFLRMQQRKPVAQTKIRNLITGKVISRNFQHTESFEEAEIKYREVKFLYSHPDRKSSISNGTSRGKFIFCEINDPSKRFELSEEQIGDASRFLKPNSEVSIMEFQDKIINISLPIKLEFKVIEAPPSVRGNTAQGGVKVVKIETGALINVPLFIGEGDIIRINTQTGEYTERVEKGAK
ncbi:MAG: elongation factor P [Candidatus Portnoybacteria bacterium CG10_big_fil_rev_8_21_14_0_10_38_18]|uniref:Elongation factor P n=1 Tax=Candidatus Portnoybacteria bacterium CG10_big_fil_rev_8_21_14_0_10_38_18 TaxID=1974813 RepID=A0A2M8KCA8_9BACT|nr:MAG: elongation factor P [Candidatus Portnoybacteria bacterium CG10_big_fil_rev_8_21_14_0_10_38_18]